MPATAAVDRAKPAHTPGTWTNRLHSTFVSSEHGNVCVCGDPHASGYVGYTEAEIGSSALDEAVANARLIASAPDMLAACELFTRGARDAVNALNAAGCACPASIALAAEKARAALAKAEGRAS